MSVVLPLRIRARAEQELRIRTGTWTIKPEEQQELGLWRVEDSSDPDYRSWLVRGGTRLSFIKPMAFQIRPFASPAQQKLWRFGRRAGKTRLAFRSAIAGHGPIGRWSRGSGPFRETWDGHLWRGILSGKDVVWLARDLKQAGVVWEEELVKKFKGRPGVNLVKDGPYVELEGQGRLWVKTNENIDSIRGIGENLGGVVTDESAYFDLEYAIKEVLQPALLDNEGWLIIMSTTNAGRDGNKERPEGPSYFNMLCEQVIASRSYREKLAAGEPDLLKPEHYRDETWDEFHLTARDNPRISPQALQKLYEELEGTHAAAQEIDALLLKGLYGLAFPTWRDDLHVRPYTLTELDGYYWRGGLDMGFGSPGWFGLGAFGPRSQEHLHAEYSFNGHTDRRKNLTAFQVGQNIGRLLQLFPMPDRIDADSSMWDTGDSHGGRRISDADELTRGLKSILGDEAPKLWKAAKGKGSRVTRVNLFRESLRYTEVEVEQDDGSKLLVVPPWGRPKFTVHPRCQVFRQRVPALPVSPVNIDDVDTDANDHPFDGWTYLTQSRPRHAKDREPPKKQHQHPGLKQYIEGQNGNGPTGPRWQRHQTDEG